MINESALGLTPEYISAIPDLSVLLSERQISFRRLGAYIQVGDLPYEERWLLELSVIPQQLTHFLAVILPELFNGGYVYRIPFNLQEAEDIIMGRYGYAQFSKVVIVGAVSDAQLLQLAEHLTSITTQFRGADIPGSSLLGGTVYARFADFSITDNIHPFSLPCDVRWPFGHIAVPVLPVKENVLNKSYRPIGLIKANFKGNVIKAVFFKNIFKMGMCVIKQGRKNVFVDDEGRDARDRLMWQFKLHKALERHIKIPKAIDLFTINEDVYFAMQLIKGRPLDEVVADLQNFSAWWQLPIHNKKRLIDLLLQIVFCVKTMHQLGYLHRDLSPENFMVVGENVFVIDMELAYDFRNNEPQPPYKWGTYGFRPPTDRVNDSHPTEAYDVFGLGGLMQVFFTGFSPVRLDFEQTDYLYDKLVYFIKEEAVASLIAACVRGEADARPVVDNIYTFLLQYRKKIDKIFYINEGKANVDLSSLLKKGMGYFNRFDTLTTELIWVSKYKKELQADPVIGVSPGFFDGVSGGVFLLAQLRHVGIDTEGNKAVLAANLDYLQRVCLYKLDSLVCGLNGVGGVILAISASIEAGIIDNTDDWEGVLTQLLQHPLQSTNVHNGVAGYGLAVLHGRCILGETRTREVIERCVFYLIQQQKADGSWEVDVPSDGKYRRMIEYLYGVTGIVYALWRLAEVFGDENVINAAKKGTNWLVSNLTANNRVGGIDMLFCLLTGYKVCGDVRYRYLLEQGLNTLPDYIHAVDTCYESGVAGLGDLLLEAGKVLNDSRCQKGAEHILTQISNLEIRLDPMVSCWRMDEYSLPSIELFTGTGGILYFLLRCYKVGSELPPLLL